MPKAPLKPSARACRQCGNELIRLSPAHPTGDDILWGLPSVGQFWCRKCDIKTAAPLGPDEMRDLELAPRARA